MAFSKSSLPFGGKFLPAIGDAISDLGYGVARGGFKNGFGIAAERGSQMQPYRDQEALRRRTESEQAASKNATVEWIRAQAATDPRFNDILAGLDSGALDAGGAFNAALGLKTQAPELTANQSDYMFAQDNPGFAEWVNPPKQGNALDPTSAMQEYQLAQSQGYAGTFMDYQNAGKQAGKPPMNATTQKELFEAEDAATAGGYVLSALDKALELNQSAVDGPFAGERAYIGANIPDIGIGNANQQDYATLEFQNITTELALNQLKTIFGAMPTEGERKILLELQGSVDKPKAVRQDILMRARQMAERRIADARAKAEGLRSGAYFQEGYGQQPATPSVDELLQKYQ